MSWSNSPIPRDCIKQRQKKTDYEHITVFAHYELAMLLVQCSKDVGLID